MNRLLSVLIVLSSSISALAVDQSIDSFVGEWVIEVNLGNRIDYNQIWIKPNGEFASDIGFGRISIPDSTTIRLNLSASYCELNMTHVDSNNQYIAKISRGPDTLCDRVFDGRWFRKDPSFGIPEAHKSSIGEKMILFLRSGFKK